MKAIADAYTVPDAAVQAIAAGCDGVLVCRANVSDRTGDAEAQVAVLEALVHAVEDGRIPFKRAEDALARNRLAKERYLAAPVAPGRHAALRQLLGNDEHRRIADEMSRYL
jgi:beta-glucosidase-like glycosyl hydrolase